MCAINESLPFSPFPNSGGKIAAIDGEVDRSYSYAMYRKRLTSGRGIVKYDPP